MRRMGEEEGILNECGGGVRGMCKLEWNLMETDFLPLGDGQHIGKGLIRPSRRRRHSPWRKRVVKKGGRKKLPGRGGGHGDLR
jgi:hypothetical protein